MSFLLDPPLLLATGMAIERYTADERTADRLATGTLGLYLGVSIPLWNDVRSPVLDRIWRPFPSAGPRDFMVNSGVFSLPVPRRAEPRHHLAAAAVFATYPLALALGRRLGRRWRARVADRGSVRR